MPTIRRDSLRCAELRSNEEKVEVGGNPDGTDTPLRRHLKGLVYHYPVVSPEDVHLKDSFGNSRQLSLTGPLRAATPFVLIARACRLIQVLKPTLDLRRTFCVAALSRSLVAYFELIPSTAKLGTERVVPIQRTQSALA